jgi:hypothetical protein
MEIIYFLSNDLIEDKVLPMKNIFFRRFLLTDGCMLTVV